MLDDSAVVNGRVVAVSPIAGTPLRMVLTAPEDAIVAPATSTDRVEWVLLAVFALVTLAGLIVLSVVGASRRRSMQAQAQSEEAFRLTVDYAPIGMSLVSLDGQILRPNAQLCRMLGYEADRLVALHVQDITHPDDLNTTAELDQRLIAGEISHYDVEQRYIRNDGRPVWARLSVSLVHDTDGLPLHFVSQVEDVTEVRAAQEQLEQRALYDPLTGLANRSLLTDRLAHALATHRRDDGLVAVAFCDVDHFKQVNDSLGHHVGDEVLRELARRLQSVVRGGDEFVLILPRASSVQMAVSVLDRARKAVGQPFEIDGHSLSISFSAGVATGRPDQSAETLLRDADLALYAAKAGGRSRAEVFTAAMRSRALEQVSIEEELRRAIEDDEFELHYQPIVALADGHTVAFEALLRWRHPQRGLLLPADFLDVAEESHLIIPLGQLVLRHACQFLARHPAAAWRVYVNVAPIQLGRDLDGAVRVELDAAWVPASRLGLEITENGVLNAAGSSLTEMAALQAMGIELLMDEVKSPVVV
ncbi:MAG: diguanylate cyclase [Actinomycetota bacterium]|nr:diguanylate cyclase [Actinomycetota bacterium]